jgi:hypothetical protein
VNLANAAEVAPFASSDVIFCRNVFIYFSDDAIRATVKVFADHMPPTGILFLSAAEALARLGVNFELTELGQAFAYVKGGQRLNIEAMRRPRAVAEPLAPLAEWRSQTRSACSWSTTRRSCARSCRRCSTTARGSRWSARRATVATRSPKSRGCNPTL